MHQSDEPPSFLIEPKASSCDNGKEHKDGRSSRRSSLATRKHTVESDDSASRGEAKKNEGIVRKSTGIIRFQLKF